MKTIRPLLLLPLLMACSNKEYISEQNTITDLKAFSQCYQTRPLLSDDPYKLSVSDLTAGQNATHYAITIQPNSLAELRALERDNSISVSYTPFDQSMCYPHRAPLISNTEITDTGPSCQEYSCVDNSVLPVLYAIWPVDKPFDPHLNYTIDYLVKLPEKATETPDINSVIEAIYRGEKSPTYKIGRLTFSDDYLIRTDIAVENVKIRFQYGSLIQDVYTNSSGYFLAPSGVSDSTSVSYVLQGSDWTVSYDSYSAPFINYIGKVGSLWHYSPIYNHVATGLYETVYRAADYLYTTSFSPQLTLYPDITIKVQSFPSESKYGSFAYNSTEQYILIYPRSGTDNEFISATLHELGHAMQFVLHGGTSTSFSNIERVVKESFASFIGWYYGEQYYLGLGWIKPESSCILNHNARQNWMVGDTLSYYTPFFVDLVDDYDQSSSNSNYLWDGLSGCSISDIMFMAQYPNTLEQVLSKTFDFCYPSEDVSDYIWQYRNWKNTFVHYPPDWW